MPRRILGQGNGKIVPFLNTADKMRRYLSATQGLPILPRNPPGQHISLIRRCFTLNKLSLIPCRA